MYFCMVLIALINHLVGHLKKNIGDLVLKVAQWLDYWALIHNNRGSNPPGVISKLWQFCSPHISPVHSAV